jgi:2'-5' RNA ligase
MRLFTGISIPDDIVQNVARLIDHLRPTAHIKWSPPYNFHITTKFIGEFPEERLNEIVDVLRRQPATGAIPIAIRGIGWFPNPHSPRVLWTGIEAPDALAQLARQTDEATAALGIARETKSFKPHLTLARIKDAVPLAEVRRAIADLKSVDFGEFTAREYHLYLSKPGPSGTVYTQLATFPIAQ